MSDSDISVETPLVSIVVPCRNEEDFIDDFIQSISDQDYPKNKLEVFIVDGLSDDRTRDLILANTKRFPFIRLVDNPSKTVPYALNKGIEISHGLVLIMGVHAIYPNDYVSRLVYWLSHLDCDVVGGILNTRPKSNSVKERAIAHAMSSLFGVGNSYFRIGARKPTEVDTVPFGLYKREVFEKIGVFDTDLTRNQDDEFNARLKLAGGKIFLIPEVKITYFPRDSFRKLWTMYFQYGYFKPLVNVKTGSIISIRQLVPAIFIIILAFSLGAAIISMQFIYLFMAIMTLYLLIAVYFASSISGSSILLIANVIICFMLLHFSYGLGFIRGVWDFIILKKNKIILKKEFKTNR